ncbi:retrovirus-related pol polyprotein from transposon TNT 1-94 [Tanacetum coccineum]
MFKLDIEPISPKLKNNRDAHEVYIEKTIEYADTLCGFVERARTQYPSEPLLESTCMFTKHVQELLVYASHTYPNSPKPSEKLVAITPINKDKRVRFAEPVTSSNIIPKQTDSLKTKDSNKPLLTSTGVKPTTSGSGSKPSRNTKNNRIMFTPKKIVHLKETTPKSVETPKSEIKIYSMRPKQIKLAGSSKKAKIVESKIPNNSEPTHLWGSNATNVPSSFSLVNDRNDQVAKIMGYGDYQQGNAPETNLYTIYLDDMLKTSPICLLSKALKTKSWLWHRCLMHLNFSTLNKLSKHGLARGISKLKFQKDHLCSACALGKSKKSSHQPKAEDNNQEKL